MVMVETPRASRILRFGNGRPNSRNIKSLVVEESLVFRSPNVVDESFGNVP